MPALEEIVQVLRRVPLFAALDLPALRALAALTTEVELAPGEIVYRQGEPGTQYYIVREGTLRATRTDAEGHVTEVRQLGAGDSFGETSLLVGDVRDVTVQAIGDQKVVLFCIAREDFDQLLKDEPRIAPRLKMRDELKERRGYPRFKWLEKDELPLRVLRKHIIYLWPNLLLPTLIVLALVVGILAAESVFLSTSLEKPILILGAILMLFPLGLGLYLYIDWRNDLYILTNRRVAHQEKVGIFKAHFSAAPLHAIQDIQQVHAGILEKGFDIGDLIIETAGAGGHVVFRNIPHPGKIRELIFEQIERTRALARAQERLSIERAMRGYFLQETAQQEAAAEAAEPSRPAKLLSALRSLVRYFIPPSWQREGATITWRRHWIGLLRTVSLPLGLWIVITVVILVIVTTKDELLWELALVYVLAILVLFPWLLWQFEDWQNDYYQVTATRIINVQRLPLFLREERREANLEQVTNVRSSQSFGGRVFGYGTVIVETAAPAGTFRFDLASRPQDVQAEIFAHIEAARRRRQQQEAERHRAEMLDWFSIYDEMRRNPPQKESRSA